MAAPTKQGSTTKDVEKSVDSEPEVESMQEAIEASSSSGHDGRNDEEARNDLEKIPTQASKGSHPPATRVRTAQDWDGPDDPDNPLNWSSWKKARHFWPVAFLALAVTAASSIIAPANQDLQQYFGISRTAAVLPVTLYVVGLGAGPVIAAPLSEQYGRSIVYKVTAPIFLLFLLGAGFSKSFGSLCVCRILAGMAGAPVLAVGTGTNADLFVPKDRAFSTSMFIMMPFLGPTAGPVIGGFAAQFKGWQWTQWCAIFLGTAAFLTSLPMEETYKKSILQKRAKKLGLPPPPGPKVMTAEYWKILFTTTLIRPVSMICTEPIVLLFGIYNSFTFGIVFAFFPAFPYTFTKEYNFNTWQGGLTFLGIGVGVILASITSILCDRFIYLKKHKQAISQGKTTLPPEERLYAGMLGAVGLPVGLFWFAWTARSDVHWISPILAGVPFAWGNLALFLSAVLYQVDVYGARNGSSAMAANGLLRYTTGGCFPLFAVQMYERLGIQWATSLLAFVCVAMLPIPFAFYRYGPAIRRRSRYNSAAN